MRIKSIICLYILILLFSCDEVKIKRNENIFYTKSDKCFIIYTGNDDSLHIYNTANFSKLSMKSVKYNDTLCAIDSLNKLHFSLKYKESDSWLEIKNSKDSLLFRSELEGIGVPNGININNLYGKWKGSHQPRKEFENHWLDLERDNKMIFIYEDRDKNIIENNDFHEYDIIHLGNVYLLKLNFLKITFIIKDISEQEMTLLFIDCSENKEVEFVYRKE